MQNLKVIFCIVFTAFILIGCGDEPNVDGQSAETFQTSVEAVKLSLAEPDRERLETALKGFEFLYGENALSVLDDSTRIRERVRTRLSGLNGQEVMELWDERCERAIRQLVDKKAVNEAALKAMEGVVIQRSRFRINSAGQRIVEMKIKNDTEHRLTHIYFRGILTSRGRRTPWVDDTFHYGFELDPEESVEQKFSLLGATWQDAPEDRKNFNLDVRVIRIDRDHETPIYDAYTNPFTKHDQERLGRLRQFQTERAAENNDALSVSGDRKLVPDSDRLPVVVPRKGINE